MIRTKVRKGFILKGGKMSIDRKIVWVFGLLPFLVLMALLPMKVYARDKEILMFLWQGETSAEKGFKDALAEELPDQNINYTLYDASKDMDRLRDLIDQTDQAQYDLIYTYGSVVTSRVIKVIKKTPIVFDIVFDPISYQIMDSWDVKQPNLAGASNSIPISLQIQKIHEAFGFGDIGIIYNPLDKNSEDIKAQIEEYLNQKGANLFPFEFRENFNSLRTYLDSVGSRVKCIYLPSERLVVGYLQRILSEINRKQMRTCVTDVKYLRMGGILCISAEYNNVGKMAGRLAAQILRGASPADLPVKRPAETDITLYANSSLVKRFKIDLPKELNISYIK